ncbi:MAG TPA: hypothetical protein VGD87_12345 [Archangium sp.]
MKSLLPVLAFFSLTACGGSGFIGSRYVKSQVISALEGGIFSITAGDDSRLAGTVVTVPPGALSEDTALTAELGLDDLSSARAGSVLVLGPRALQLGKEIEIALPFTLGTQQSRSALSLVALDDSGSREVPIFQVDDSSGLVRFRTTRLGAFQCAAGSADGGASCVTDDTCPDEHDCKAGRCVPKSNDDSP